MSSRSGLGITGLDMSAPPSSSKRDSFFSRLVSPNGLPSSPSPRGRATSEYWGTISPSPRSPAVGWQSPVSQHGPSPPSPSYSTKTQSTTMSYLPMSYSPSSYSPVSQSSSAQSPPPSPQYTEKKAKASNSKRLSSMFSRFGGKKHPKTKVVKVREEEEYEEIKAHNDWMDEDY